MAHDAVLLISFGGPGGMDEIRPFLANVLRGRPVPPERIEAVVHHYELIGGRSPLTALTLQQAEALRVALAAAGRPLPVYVGMRNWHPYLAETLTAMRDAGVQRAVGVILAAQQNDASWERYQRDVAEARAAVGDDAPVVDFAPNWHAHPLFIEAVAERVRAALATVPAARRDDILLIFTAHSIPLSLAAASPYEAQLQVGAALIAEQVGVRDYRLAYQSRSGSPREPWLEPDIGAVVRQEAGRGRRELLVVPLGFVCDHVEVLYDLDIEAKQIADEVGIGFTRVAAVNDHPSFISMLAAVVVATARA
ncbi:MAG: ferrochelatase [bacterium]